MKLGIGDMDLGWVIRIRVGWGIYIGIYIYIYIFGFTPCKAEQPLEGMKLQEKDAQKD